MDFLRRIFNKAPKENTNDSQYAGQNAIAEHDFFEAGSILHGGENSNKRIEMSAADINAPFEAKAEQIKRQESVAEIKRQEAAAKIAQARELQAQKDQQKIEVARAKIEQAAPKNLPNAIKTVTIEHSPLEPKPKITVLQGGASEVAKTEKAIWHTDGTANELPISGTEALNEEIFFGQQKKREVMNRTSVANLGPQKKPSDPSASPATEEKRAA